MKCICSGASTGVKETSNGLHEGYCSLSSVLCHFPSSDLYFQHIDFLLTQPCFAEKRGIESLSCLHITIVHASLKVKVLLSGDGYLTDNVIRIVGGVFIWNGGGHTYQSGGKRHKGTRIELSFKCCSKSSGFALRKSSSDNTHTMANLSLLIEMRSFYRLWMVCFLNSYYFPQMSIIVFWERLFLSEFWLMAVWT